MMRFFERNRRGISFFLLLSILNSLFAPGVALALTSGPAQPEASNFTPVGTSDMVNLFSGDLNYNIPLMDVGGYPINISYNGGSFMDQEASWVGLGWNINAGAINRNMRGLPDDYNGDEVIKEMNMKANETYGVTIGAGGEIFGVDAVSLNYSLGITYNNYTGYGICQSLGLSITPGEGFPGTIGLGLSSSADGLTISPKLTFSAKLDEQEGNSLNGSVSIGTSFNSRTGLKAISLDASLSAQSSKDKKSDAVNGKENKHSGSAGSYSKGTSYDFGVSTFIPQLSMPMHNKSYLFSLALGGTIFGVDLTGNITGNYSKQSLKHKTENIAAYGYMYQENGEDKEKVMLDFNREKDGAFSENSVLLPLTNNTYDIYSVSGQGVGGSYRLFRGDIGYVFDSKVTTTNENNSLSGDISLGNAVQGGINYYNTTVEQQSGKWTDNNPMTSRFHFRGKNQNDVYEPAYFKEAGEMVVDEDNLFNSVMAGNSVRFDIDDGGFETWTTGKLNAEDGASVPAPASNKRAKRAKRNQLLSYLTKKEYKAAALNTDLYAVIPSTVPDHHVAEISTTKNDGTRYVYGLPIFNTKQIERSFNATGNSVTNGQIAYSPGSDDSPGNSKGIDNFYSSSELPPYAYTYLLTAVLSADYVDVTGNGPTDDDLGNYTKFEYGTGSTGAVNPSCNANNISSVMDYKWRTPYATSAKANYDEGLKTDPNDDKGSYVYGEKQISYLKQITTKNYVAVFNLQNRRDGAGIAGSSGGVGTAQKLLESIQLFSKPDFIANGSNAFLIKQVNFAYNYELCTQVPNNTSTAWTSPFELANQGGKLTLKKIYFSYGKSKKAHLSPYEFTYNTTALDKNNNTFTPTYDTKGYDRWGTYKPSSFSGIPNSENPYVEQNKNRADTYARLWNLRTITLPSGGKITIDLESDDYAYVQNKRAAQMFSVVGAASSIPTTFNAVNYLGNSSLFTTLPSANCTVFYFKLNEPIDFTSIGISAANNLFRNEYLSGIEDLYFRFYTKVNGSTATSSNGFEYVSGYGKIINSGVVNSVNYSASTTVADYGWVQLDEVNRGDKDGNGLLKENPVTKAAWQFGRMHTPRMVFSTSGQPANPGGGISDFLQAMADASFFKNTVEFFMGMYGKMKLLGYGQSFQPGRSWIKLNNPKKNRLGGGHRVKQITLSDEWSTMLSSSSSNSNKSFSYGQTYDYSTSDSETNYPVSSGVAAYEPSFGADENPCRYPIFNAAKKEEILLAPDNDLYQEGPYGESFYPSPCVGYSKVTVRNLDRANVTKNATGKVTTEFYTAKDFPVIVKQPTDLYIKRKKSNPIQKLLSMNFEDNITASQGYCIEINDMHGKQKASTVYDATDNKISGATYYYKQDGANLSNTVPVMSKNGSISNKTIGVDFDMITDFREQKSVTETIGIQGNLYFMMVGVFPLFIPPIIPSYHKEQVRFRSAGVTKVVQRFGILEKTVAEDLASKVETSNLIWDAETGQTLLTNTNTEFKDNLYNFNYPAYYAYSGMAPAYQNIGMEFTLGTLANSASGSVSGQVNISFKSFLEPGDEFIIIDDGTNQPIAVGSGNSNDSKCWVKKQGNDLYLIDKNGLSIFSNANISTSSSYTVKLIRSGKRNQQASSAGNLVTFNSPVDYSSLPASWPLIDGSKNVLNASAIEYGNSWRTFCNCGLPAPGSNANEYLSGRSGIYRQKKSYAYLTMREQTKVNNNSNIRKDGVFEKFDPFWTPNAGNDWNKPGSLNSASPKWTWASEVTEYSPYGFELENKDALNRYSAAVYGYNNTLPVAVGSNTKYKQIAFDNFEDYDFNPCANDGHFNFKSSSQTPLTYMSGDLNNQKFAHSGRKSIKVASGQPAVKVTKDLQPCQ